MLQGDRVYHREEAAVVPESAIKQFLGRILAAKDAGMVPNALEIGKAMFGDPVLESTARVVEQCKARGLLSRADLDYTGIDLSPEGEAYARS
jgi:hypothetical protein